MGRGALKSSKLVVFPKPFGKDMLTSNWIISPSPSRQGWKLKQRFKPTASLPTPATLPEVQLKQLVLLYHPPLPAAPDRRLEHTPGTPPTNMKGFLETSPRICSNWESWRFSWNIFLRFSNVTVKFPRAMNMNL